MEALSKEFTELEMWQNILAGLSLDLSMSFWAKNSSDFPTSLEKLEDNLKYVETQVVQHESMVNELQRKAGLSVKETKGKAKMGKSGKIPKKQETGSKRTNKRSLK